MGDPESTTLSMSRCCCVCCKVEEGEGTRRMAQGEALRAWACQRHVVVMSVVRWRKKGGPGGLRGLEGITPLTSRRCHCCIEWQWGCGQGDRHVSFNHDIV